MNRTAIILAAAAVLVTVGGIMHVARAADHIDAPAVTGTKSDITDLYVFESPETSSNLVFVANVQGLLDPTATASASFDPNVMLEFNIDNDGDLVEDLVIQCTYVDGTLAVYGPVTPSATGDVSLVEGQPIVTTAITTYGSAPSIGINAGIKAFAGPRDDPFFFDLGQYQAIIGGTATGFNNPGVDALAGTNVMATVVEVPKSLLGNTMLNCWVEAKRKQ